MALTNEDLQAIKLIVAESSANLESKIHESANDVESRLTAKIHDATSSLETRLTSKIHESANDVEARLTSKIVDATGSLETRLISRFDALEARMDKRFDKVFNHLDGLAKQNQDREQEYVVMRGRIDRLEKKCA